LVNVAFKWTRLEETLPIPYTLVLFAIGFVWGVVNDQEEWAENGVALGEAVATFNSIDPHLFLMLFLPALLFESGLKLNTHIFGRLANQALLLAGPGVIITMCIAAAFIKAVFPTDTAQGYGWSWGVCLLFGSMAAATDPVAVVALLGELGAPASLGTLVEGESLLNDGSAFVAFLVIIKGIREHGVSAGDIGIAFCQLAIGGAALGLAVGFVATHILKINYNKGDRLMELALLFVSPYFTFYLAEGVLGLSGVLAVVCLAVYMKSHAHFHIYDLHTVHAFWDFLCWIANTLMFLIIGGMVGDHIEDWRWEDTGFLILLYIGLTLVRALTIAMLAPFLQHLGYGFTWQQGVVLTWGALRGGIGLAMAAIVLAEDSIHPKVRQKIFLHMSGIVAGTLVLNGCSMGWALRKLGYTERTIARKILATNAVGDLKRCAIDEIRMVKRSKIFDDADWVEVNHMLQLSHLEHLFIDEDSLQQEQGEKETLAGHTMPGVGLTKSVSTLEDAGTRYREASSHGTIRRKVNARESPTMMGETGSDISRFTHSEVSHSNAYEELREQFLHAFIAQVEAHRHEGELSGSSASILHEAAETALDPDCSISLAEWWDTIVRPLCSSKMEGASVKVRCAQFFDCTQALEHFFLTGTKRAIEVAKSFCFICHTVRKRVLSTKEDSTISSIDKEVRDEVIASIKDAAEFVAELIYAQGNDHIARQVDTRRALGHVLRTLIHEVDHMWHDGKLHTDECGELKKELHAIERGVQIRFTSNTLLANQIDVLSHILLLQGLDAQREPDFNPILTPFNPI